MCAEIRGAELFNASMHISCMVVGWKPGREFLILSEIIISFVSQLVV